MIGFGQQTYVPDDNFEQALINLGYDNVLDDYVITANIDTVTKIYVPFYNISNLTGIESFTALEVLTCSSNDITSLDLSQNINLIYLYCELNPLSTIDLTQNTSLVELYCGLDFDQNNNSLVGPGYTLLSDLNITQNTMLRYLSIGKNELISLDVSQNVALKQFHIDSSLITVLDLTNNVLLESFGIEGSPIFSLDIRNGNNIIIDFLAIINNLNLNCINVDDSTLSSNNWVGQDFFFDSWSYFSNNCSGTTAIQEQTTNKELLKITDLLGRETKQTNQPLFYIYDDGTVEKRIVIE